MVETLLVVDDDPKMQSIVAEVLGHEGFRIHSALNGRDAERIVGSEPVNLVLLDIKLPDTDGITLLGKFVRMRPSMPVIMISGFGTVDRAVAATKLGAYDFLEKPLEPQRVLLTIRNALEHARMRAGQDALIEELMQRYGLVGASREMKNLCVAASRIAKHDIPVLITGENGTGKEMLAGLIHALSGRGEMVCLNCAAVPRELIESELFGHKRGSFTGAVGDARGKFLAADGGTLFLDEIGDMAVEMQAKILRALETKQVSPIGSQETRPVDVRFVAATNKNLEKCIGEGAFRQDLYYRLRGIQLHVPPLRDRAADIRPLAVHFLGRYRSERTLPPLRFSETAFRALERHDWPGNVRELKHAVENAAVLAEGEVIDHLQISSILSPRSAAAPVNGGGGRPGVVAGRAAAGSEAGGRGGNEALHGDGQASPRSGARPSLRDETMSYEKAMIQDALDRTAGNITHAAETLGMDRATLSKKIKRYGLKQ